MSHNNPRSLTEQEWAEVYQQPDVRALWGLDSETGLTVDDWKVSVYAVHFDFVSGSPGYVGDLYLIQGDYLADVPPAVLVRDDNGALRVHEWSVFATA
jgi:hypothetical protein